MENERTFTRRHMVPCKKSQKKALNNKADGHDIKIFCDRIPRGIRIKEFNYHLKQGNAR